MINQLLELHYYDGEFAVPTVTPNKTVEAKTLSALPIYAKWQLMPLRDRMGTLKDIEQTGLLQITLFTDVATGTALIDQKAQAIVDYFGTERSHTISGVQVMIMSSTAMGAMPDGTGKFMMPVTIEYRIDKDARFNITEITSMTGNLEKLVNEDLPSALGSIS